MKKPQVKYRYALNANNELIEIHSAHEIGGIYYCPECGEQMILKCGSKKAWHFSHDKVECDYNHYLHTIAERRIAEWFNAAVEIPIVLQINEVCESKKKCRFFREELCCKPCFSDAFNLKDYYSLCEIEKRYTKDGHTYIADIICWPKYEKYGPLFIEICVTHPCEEEKLSSGIRIIELVIQSEEDIDRIIGTQMIAGENLRFYNFHARDKLSLNQSFENFLQKFILFPSKKGFIKTIHCSERNHRRGDMEITIPYNGYVPDFLDDGGFFSIAYAVAFQYDNTLRHCCLCKYHAYDVLDGFGICKLYKKYGTNRDSSTNDAQQCRFFRIDVDLIQTRKSEFDDYSRHNPVDVWMNNNG